MSVPVVGHDMETRAATVADVVCPFGIPFRHLEMDRCNRPIVALRCNLAFGGLTHLIVLDGVLVVHMRIDRSWLLGRRKILLLVKKEIAAG